MIRDGEWADLSAMFRTGHEYGTQHGDRASLDHRAEFEYGVSGEESDLDYLIELCKEEEEEGMEDVEQGA